MTLPSLTMLRCDRCRAVISCAEASDMIRHGVPCGVCGGPLALGSNGQWRADAQTPADDSAATSSASPERRLLGVLREADGEPVAPRMLSEAGIDDPANAIFELEQAGHRIERAYADASNGRRRFLGYRLRRGLGGRHAGGASQPRSSL
jgi:hypothetical protein